MNERPAAAPPLDVTSSAPLREAESRIEGEPFSLYLLESWGRSHPGLIAGITEASPTADFGASNSEEPTFLERVERLGDQLGFSAVAWARQIHGVGVRRVDEAVQTGFFSPGEADGLLTRRSGRLLLVTVADCVPVYVVEPNRQVLSLLHAGWRGTAAGILPRAIAAMEAAYGSTPPDLWVHLGPAICGECYEVGPEVLDALGRVSRSNDRLDLRSELARRALESGVSEDRLTCSTWCTRCDEDRFHSHRGRQKSAGRMAAFLGWLDRAPPLQDPRRSVAVGTADR